MHSPAPRPPHYACRAHGPTRAALCHCPPAAPGGPPPSGPGGGAALARSPPAGGRGRSGWPGVTLGCRSALGPPPRCPPTPPPPGCPAATGACGPHPSPRCPSGRWLSESPPQGQGRCSRRSVAGHRPGGWGCRWWRPSWLQSSCVFPVYIRYTCTAD